MSEEKICKDCKHFKLYEVPGFNTSYLCKREERPYRTVDIVTGEVTEGISGTLNCRAEREYRYSHIGGHCTYVGKFWEPKE